MNSMQSIASALTSSIIVDVIVFGFLIESQSGDEVQLANSHAYVELASGVYLRMDADRDEGQLTLRIVDDVVAPDEVDGYRAVRVRLNPFFLREVEGACRRLRYVTGVRSNPDVGRVLCVELILTDSSALFADASEYYGLVLSGAGGFDNWINVNAQLAGLQVHDLVAVEGD